MERLTENIIGGLIRDIEFPPLNFKNFEEIPTFAIESDYTTFKPDYGVNIEWENESFKFIVEVKNQATPKKTDEAIYYLKKFISAIGESEKYYPLLIAPYLSEERLEQLMKEKISGLDLSGNGLIYVPGKIFVYRSGAKNKFPSNAPIKNVFYGTSSLIGRVFLVNPEYAAVGEILDEIIQRSGNTTIGTVSKVLKTLEENLIISRSSGIRLIDGRRLLKNLSENYRKPKIRRIVKGKAENLENALGQMSENANKNGILLAINEPQRYAVMPSTGTAVKIYVENKKAVLEKIEFSENERFPNIELIETGDPTVYFDRRWNSEDNIYFTSPVQIYLELANGGKREKETAETIAEGILNFSYES